MAIKIKVLEPEVKPAQLIAQQAEQAALTCEHIWNPQTLTCITCLLPRADNEFLTPVKQQAQPTPPVVVNPSLKTGSLMAALSTPAAPWEAPAGYGIFEALKEHFDKQQSGKTLFLVHKNGDRTYMVKSYNPDTCRAVLEEQGQYKTMIKPVISAREASLYNPFWRG